MNNFNIKTIVYVAGAVALVVLGAWYAMRYVTPTPQAQSEAVEMFTGGLVQIDETTLTVKAADGVEKIIPYSAKTRVISQVQEDEVGRTAMQLGAGDVVSFAVGRDGVPMDGIELIPVAELVRPEGSVVVSGAVVGKTSSSITVRPPENAAMAIVNINTDKTFKTSSSTLILTQVLGGEVGKGDDSLFAGVAVRVFGIESGDTIVADIIEILRP